MNLNEILDDCYNCADEENNPVVGVYHNGEMSNLVGDMADRMRRREQEQDAKNNPNT